MLTKEQAIKTVLASIIEANKKQAEMSGGWWLTDAGVESIIQYVCAQRMHKVLQKQNGGGNVYLECNMAEVLNDSAAQKQPGRIPKNIDGSKRIDIVVSDANGNPIIPIEIKKNTSDPGFIKDAERIFTLLSRADTQKKGSLKYGIICAFSHGNGNTDEIAQKRLNDKIVNTKKRLKASFPDECFELHHTTEKSEYFDEYGYWAAGAVCVYLRRKRESG